MSNQTIWQSEVLYHSGDAYYAALENAINRALRQIDLEMYIFALDPVGERILNALEKAASRGVKVRLLVDGVGSLNWGVSTLRELQKRGVEARIYHPVAPYAFRFGSGFVRKWLRALLKINRRNHRKVCIIDGRVAFLGGMNISALHTAEFAGKSAWRDTSLKVTGQAVETLQIVFNMAYRERRKSLLKPNRSWKRKIQTTSSVLALNFKRRLRLAARKQLLQRIERANQRVWITNPYFVPDLRLIRALRMAGHRGVDVKLLLPRVSDVFFMRWVAGVFFSALFEAHVQIYEYLPTTLHAKTFVIDQWCCVGSSNLNHRSIIHDLEVDVVLFQPHSLLELEKSFQADLRHSEQLHAERWIRRGWVRKALERFFYRLRYWL